MSNMKWKNIDSISLKDIDPLVRVEVTNNVDRMFELFKEYQNLKTEVIIIKKDIYKDGVLYIDGVVSKLEEQLSEEIRTLDVQMDDIVNKIDILTKRLDKLEEIDKHGRNK